MRSHRRTQFRLLRSINHTAATWLPQYLWTVVQRSKVSGAQGVLNWWQGALGRVTVELPGLLMGWWWDLQVEFSNLAVM